MCAGEKAKALRPQPVQVYAEVIVSRPVPDRVGQESANLRAANKQQVGGMAAIYALVNHSHTLNNNKTTGRAHNKPFSCLHANSEADTGDERGGAAWFMCGPSRRRPLLEMPAGGLHIMQIIPPVVPYKWRKR